MQPANSPARQATRWPAATTLQGRSIRLQGRPRSTYPGPPTCPATAQAAPGAADGPGDEREGEGKGFEAVDGPRSTAFVSTFFCFFLFFLFSPWSMLVHVGRRWSMLVDIRPTSNIEHRISSNVNIRRPAPRQGHLSAPGNRPFPLLPPRPLPPLPGFPLPQRPTLDLPWTARPQASRGTPERPHEALQRPLDRLRRPSFPSRLPGTRPIDLPCAHRPTLHRSSRLPCTRRPALCHSGLASPRSPLPSVPAARSRPLKRGKSPKGKGPPASPRLLTRICILPTLYPAVGPRPASSHVLRAAGCPAHASPASGATFDFPQNSGRPPKTTDLPCSRILPTLHLPPDGQEDERRRTGETDRQTRQPVRIRIRAHHSSTYPAPAARGNDK